MSDVTTATTNSEANSTGAASGATEQAGAEQSQQAATPPETVSREAYQALQSRADKAQADADRARRDAADAIDRAEKASLEAQLANLKPEERAAVTDKWQLEREKRELAAERAQLESNAKTVTQRALAIEYGIDPKDLDDAADVNDMRAIAAEKKAARLEQELAEAKKAPTAAAQTQAPAGMRGDPAGSGAGGRQSTYDADKYKKSGDLAGSLRAKREAGDIEYATIKRNR